MLMALLRLPRGGLRLPLARAPRLQDRLPHFLGRVLNVLHRLPRTRARGLVAALGLADILFRLRHKLLQPFECFHDSPRVWIARAKSYPAKTMLATPLAPPEP